MNHRQAKSNTLTILTKLAENIEYKIKLLRSLDDDHDASDCYDLHDQLNTFEDVHKKLEGVIQRAVKVNGTWVELLEERSK